MKDDRQPARPKRVTRVDRSREEILWHNTLWESKQRPIFWVEMAGRTLPDAHYFIARSKPHYASGDLFVLEVVTSGKGYLEALGRKTTVAEGDLYVINGRIPHCYYADGENPFEKIWINVRGDFINAMEPMLLGGKPYAVYHAGQEARAVMEDIHRRIRRATPSDSEQMLSYLMKQIVELCVLADRCARAELESLSGEEQIARYVESNICLDLRVADLCEHFYLSQSTLYRRMMASFGMTPKEFILQKKIEAAKRMIAADESGFSAIASVLRFSDSHHFFRVFKKYTGISPSEYRAGILEEVGMQEMGLGTS